MPSLIEPQPKVVVYGGIKIPKEKNANLKVRASFRDLCERDEAARKEIWRLCKENPLLWLNLFGFSFSVFQTIGGEAVQSTTVVDPFITWRKQDEWMTLAFGSLMTGKSLLTEKSRDLGMTWLHLFLFVHQFLFYKQRQLLTLSYREEEIDQLVGSVSKSYPRQISSDKGTLFGKIDHCLHYLPTWMIPRMERKYLHLVNIDNGSRIDGESTTEQAGRSDRRHALYLDEFGMVEAKKAAGIRTSSANVALSRFVCSTPQGVGSEFARWRHSGSIPLFTAGWWDQPGKNDGLEVIAIEDGKKFKYTSPWYRNECEKLKDPQAIATELDIDYIASGAPFFDTAMIDFYKSKNVRPVALRLRIEFRDNVPEAQIPDTIRRRDLSKVKVTIDPKGPWSLWVLPGIKNDFAEAGDYPMRFSSDARLFFGQDISMGMGASNSVCSVMRTRDRNKIAEYTSSIRPPYAFAKDMVAAAIWFGGGMLRPLMIPEGNGQPGIDYLRQLSQVYRYPEIYRARTLGHVVEKQTDTLGFHSSRTRKAALLGNLRRQYAVGRFTNHSERSLDEAKDYITYPNGSIGPASLFAESEDVRLAHGDRVIADALCCWPGNEFDPEAKPEDKEKGSPLDTIHLCPPGSQGYRMHNKEMFYDKFKRGKPLDKLKVGEKFRIRDYI
jgi:hypothetical protein